MPALTVGAGPLLTACGAGEGDSDGSDGVHRGPRRSSRPES
ncbi:hypothetical protein [Streptomyces glaucescens]|uniref:Uncharacterized protein n=1 Tax=Streptomyces glaucescens TaxID=1907 RepID=A0A089YXW4_STRGA|nr:hypothetical protein [Streptomyces glaucescens]AIR98470.1 hypothetical protein SGLAU_12370 [Streptomyces glaucescens]